MSNIAFAFFLTLLAGLSTGIGSCIAFLSKRTNTKFLSVTLGFSAGVMIYVSFVEIFVKARESLVRYAGDYKGGIITVVSFFGGMLFIAIIDKLIPNYENPHEIREVEEMNDKKIKSKSSLHRMGIFSALAITIHNFPEGLATFMSAIENPTLGVSIAIAIAMHNIPEGIAVSVPIYFSTGSRKKAFIYSFLSGLSEPVGALVGYLLLLPFMNELIFGVIFAGVAGIMVFISLDELLPAAENYGEHHLSIYGLISGMVVMSFSLILFL
ncbi:zinc transporter ZupT [Candidatus Cetobacterium colombiensis]|uniref:Zinc transporter ZupT n=1 Tax=Candidatus Cetobacterium colombiensis TaxID=3073100 RepID=A0ABU4W9A2_9FUSO|nr:zinc transporter ZupT [Candidatus Cetobacterium colombiensis]MDX8336091.1 zinc transporter ZupT [Candidatus Cetobacterium colombiensis]